MAVQKANATRVYINANDVTCDLNMLDVDLNSRVVDTTTFCTTLGTVSGVTLQEGEVSFGGFHSSDLTAGITAVLGGLIGTTVLFTAWISDAAGSIGFAGATALLDKFKLGSKVGQMVSVSCHLIADVASAGIDVVTSLEAKQQVTGTGSAVNTTAVDNGAGTTAGGAAFFQIFATDAAPGISSLRLVHSTDNSTFTTLGRAP